MTTEAVATLEQQATTLVAEVETLTITDDATFTRAGEIVRVVAAYLKRVGEVLDPVVEAAHQAHKVAVRQRETLLRPARDAKLILGSRMAAYEAEQARLRQEAAAAAQRERERQEQAARAEAEAAQRRLQAEAETRQLEEAAALEARGDQAGAAKLLEAPVAVPVVAPAPVFTPAPGAPPPPKVEGVSFRDEWDFEIVEPARLPREFLVPDEKKIRGVVRAMKGATRIPGVRAFARRVSSVRTA